jgi:hypothetical protein
MRLIAAMCLAAALVPSLAAAQPAPWAPERLTPGWVFTPSMVVGVLHDSNVTLRAANEPITAEMVGLINPRGEVDFNGRHTHMSLGYSGSLEAYRELSELNRYEQKGRFELRHQTGPRLNFDANASYTRVPTTDRLQLEAGVVPFIGIGSDHAEVSGGFKLKTSPRTDIAGGVNVQTIRFDREITESEADDFTRYLRNGRSVSPHVTAMYSLSERLSIGGAWSYHRSVIGDGQEIFKVYDQTAEVEWLALEHTTVRGGIGSSYLTSNIAVVNRWGPAYHLGFDHVAGRTEVSASYERSFVPSIGFGGLNANERLSGNAHVPLAQGRFIVSGNIAYGVIEPVDLFGVDYTLNSVWLQGSLGYQVNRWLRAEGFINRTHQTSTARGQVDRTRVGIEFVTAKPVRIQ